MSDLRRKPGNAIADQQPQVDTEPLKRRCYDAAKRLGLAAAILIPAGMVSYGAYLSQERIRAEAVIIHLEFGQEVLIEDRDFLAKRILDLESRIEQSKQQAEVSKKLGDFLESDNQNLRDEIKKLTKNEASDKASQRQGRQADGDLAKTIAEKNARYKELSAENARLRMRMFELANAMAEHQATSAKTAELAQEKSGT